MGNEIVRHALLYKRFLRCYFQRLVEYPLDFWMGVFGNTLSQFGGLVFLWIMFTRTESIGGWNSDEVILLYGLSLSSGSLSRLLFSNLWSLGSVYIKQGDLLRLLTRPVDPLFHLFAEHFEEAALSGILLGVALVIRSLRVIGILDFRHASLAFIAILLGCAFPTAINLALASLSFWMLDSSPIMWSIGGMSRFSRYPLTIYSRGFQRLLTWVIPYALGVYYPALYILGRSDMRCWALVPCGALGFTLLALGLWSAGLRRFEGAGS